MRLHKRKILGLVVVISTIAGATACGKKDLNVQYAEDPDYTSFDVKCMTDPLGQTGWDPQLGEITPATRTQKMDLPPNLPSFTAPIQVDSCYGLGDNTAGPRFFGKQMPGMSVIVDCNARIVRFRNIDRQVWQINEPFTIGASGEFTGNVQFITRLAQDSEGTANCWTRVQGHITGHVDCPANPGNAHVNMKVQWNFDPTIPGAMEPAYEGQADLRNGPHCKIKSENCSFHNEASFGCGG